MSSLLFNRLLSSFEKIRRIRDLMFSSKYLLLTNIGISVSLSGIGDMIEQSYMITRGEQKEWNKVRTHHMTITGLPIGIICHGWYKFLDHHLPGRTLKIVLKKVLIDQILYSPVAIAVFFMTLGILEKSSADEILQELWKKGKILYLGEWMIWPPAQIINFYLLPTKYRVLYDNTISLGYDIFTSHVKYDFDDKNV